MQNLSFSADKLKCKLVTVYSDRAEVKRTLEAIVDEGQNEIFVKNIPEDIDSNSFRVDGRGDATVNDVQFQIIPAKKDDSMPEKEKELDIKIKELRDKENELQLEIDRLGMRDDMWEKAMERIQSGDQGRLIVDSFEALKTFGDEMDSQLSDIHSKLVKLDKLQQEYVDERCVLERKRIDLRYYGNYSIRQLSILLDAKSACTVELDISYIVYRSSWIPQYDIRVNAEGEKKNMKINYFGQIKQKTNEDWTETTLELSTAKPSIGGQAPEPRPLKAEFLKKEEKKEKQIERRRRISEDEDEDDDMGFGLFNGGPACLLEASAPPAPLKVEKMQVKENLVSATFHIARPTTIPSDDSEHKVSVCQLDFDPKFTYKCLPKQSEYVYLMAKIINNSDYVFLPGKAMIFFENNFLTKTEMNSVSPGEEFTCSLGADPAIRINYKPVKKYKQETGFFGKTTVMHYDQQIEVKNTKLEPIKLELLEPIPRSTDEKMKITLLTPDLNEMAKQKSKKEESAKLDKDNILHLTVNLSTGEERTIQIRYSVEYPASQDVKFIEEESSREPIILNSSSSEDEGNYLFD